eukprot:TRINITY_DN16157_c0_g1_i10.p1 TRINITY_DN16157_c0_g1~~TRINITY_DN16157_c0_g1_i10.p1  ORF type:complete len:229 (+),score=63.55 TRINITY_DN16157_c0_g1_i10:478-1164(+)
MSEGERKQVPTIPKEAQVMAGILRDLGIQDYEPGVLTQMVEFSYRYVTKVLEDAKVYSQHARKRNVDIDDVKLAVQVMCDQTVTSPPTRDVLLELAQAKNEVQLPLVRSSAGLRLPPDRHCLTSTNYRLTASRGGGGQSASSGGATGIGGIRMMNGGLGSSVGGGGGAGMAVGNAASSGAAAVIPTFQIQPMMQPPTAGGGAQQPAATVTIGGMGAVGGMGTKRKWDE